MKRRMPSAMSLLLVYKWLSLNEEYKKELLRIPSSKWKTQLMTVLYRRQISSMPFINGHGYTADVSKDSPVDWHAHSHPSAFLVTGTLFKYISFPFGALCHCNIVSASPNDIRTRGHSHWTGWPYCDFTLIWLNHFWWLRYIKQFPRVAEKSAELMLWATYVSGNTNCSE